MTHSVNGVSQVLPPLPLAFEYIYVFTSGIGGIHRKMSPARWNGNEVSKSYLVYSADQMRAYARAAIAVQPPAASQPSEPAFYINPVIIDSATGKVGKHIKSDLTWSRMSAYGWKMPVYLAPPHQPPAASRPSDLQKFLDEAGAEGLVLGGIDAGDLYVSLYGYNAPSSAQTPPAASQPSDGLEHAFRQLDERAGQFAESHDREENEYAAGITDALTIIRAALAAVQGKK